MNPNIKRSEYLSCVKSILARLSLGKYGHGLYFNKRVHYGTYCGGILTIISLLVFVVYTSIVLKGVFNRDRYELDHSITKIDDFMENDLTIGKLEAIFYHTFILYLDPDIYAKTCEGFSV